MNGTSYTHKLLINEPPLQVLPSLAARIGLNQALVLQQVHYCSVTLPGKIVEGRKWIFQTDEKWCEQFSFWSKNTVRHVLADLETARLIDVGDFNDNPMIHTKWYAINYEILDDPSPKPKRKRRSDFPNFGKSMAERKRAQNTTNADLPNLGNSSSHALEDDSTETPDSKNPLESDSSFTEDENTSSVLRATLEKVMEEQSLSSKKESDIPETLGDVPSPLSSVTSPLPMNGASSNGHTPPPNESASPKPTTAAPPKQAPPCPDLEQKLNSTLVKVVKCADGKKWQVVIAPDILGEAHSTRKAAAADYERLTGVKYIPPVQDHMGPIHAFLTALGSRVPPTVREGNYARISKDWHLAGITPQQCECAGKLYATYISALQGDTSLKWQVGDVRTAAELALEMCRKGIKPVHVERFMVEKYREIDPRSHERFWQGKFMKLEYVAHNVGSLKVQIDKQVENTENPMVYHPLRYGEKVRLSALREIVIEFKPTDESVIDPRNGEPITKRNLLIACALYKPDAEPEKATA